jgi:phospholipase/carboxylesterase
MSLTTDLNYVHTFVPAPSDSSRPVTLLLLHGAGGDENSLLPVGNDLWPGAALLGLRGKILENGMPSRFRFTEPGVGDVRSRAEELAEFIRAASGRYGFSMKRLIIIGHSDGANLAASLILLHPHYLAGAILFRVMVPLVPEIIRDFRQLSVFIGAASLDPLIAAGQPEELAAIFRSGGANVVISWHRGGHELGADDVQAARNWLARDMFRKWTGGIDREGQPLHDRIGLGSGRHS